MEEAIKKYETLISRVEADIEEADVFRDDLYKRYNDNAEIDEMIKIQSMIMKITDYISQKEMTKVELERQLIDITKALESV